MRKLLLYSVCWWKVGCLPHAIDSWHVFRSEIVGRDCYWDSQCRFSCFKSQFVFNRREKNEYNVLQYSSTVACRFHSTLENENWNGMLSMLGNSWGQRTMSQLCFWAVIAQKANSNNTRFTHYTAECLLLLYMHGNLRSHSTVGLRRWAQMSMLWPRMLAEFENHRTVWK